MPPKVVLELEADAVVELLGLLACSGTDSPAISRLRTSLAATLPNDPAHSEKESSSITPRMPGTQHTEFQYSSTSHICPTSNVSPTPRRMRSASLPSMLVFHGWDAGPTCPSTPSGRLSLPPNTAGSPSLEPLFLLHPQEDSSTVPPPLPSEPEKKTLPFPSNANAEERLTVRFKITPRLRAELAAADQAKSRPAKCDSRKSGGDRIGGDCDIGQVDCDDPLCVSCRPAQGIAPHDAGARMRAAAHAVLSRDEDGESEVDEDGDGDGDSESEDSRVKKRKKTGYTQTGSGPPLTKDAGMLLAELVAAIFRSESRAALDDFLDSLGKGDNQIQHRAPRDLRQTASRP
ncbi:hypothetical protein R3P38DRAFT_3218024 [Favolaschia claudopus]|uniref:Uncharacterized protein n=1 Tax=Favolaschia claudopus TaxID=2862362 RepID=A0AAW0A3V6_9AGAR